jgi:hypothetical protein
MQIGIIACCSKKAPSATLAQDLYQSTLFKKSREYVENNTQNWLIVSAKYGLIFPGQVIEPYDQTLNKMSKDERTAWKNIVVRQLTKLQESVNQPITFVVLAGAKYRTPFEFFDHTIPMEGLGIGLQLQWLTEANTVIEQFTCVNCNEMVSWDQGCHHGEGSQYNDWCDRCWSKHVKPIEVELSTWDAEYDMFDQLTRNGIDVLTEEHRINIQDWVKLMQLEHKTQEGKFTLSGFMCLLLFNQLERVYQNIILSGAWERANCNLRTIFNVGIGEYGEYEKFMMTKADVYEYAKELWKEHQTKVMQQAKELNHDK